MKYLLLALIVAAAAWMLVSQARAAEAVTPSEAQRRVQAGEAILIDVREPPEWQDGVAEPARLLPLSDLRADRTLWQETLEKDKDKELILYCRTGNRSAQAAAILAKEGYKVLNAGGFADWERAALPTRRP